MVNQYSCCIYVHNQAKFTAYKLFYYYCPWKKEMGIIVERKIVFASLSILDSSPVNCL